MSRTENKTSRRLPVGAEIIGLQSVHFRVWAPERKKITVVMEDGQKKTPQELTSENNGYFSGSIAAASEGTLYRFQMDDNVELMPDPASRFQPQGPFGPSQVINPDSFAWSDRNWPGVRMPGQIIYEMHIGTFTTEGTWESARQQLEALANTGITLLEVMPVGDFPGQFGWGYDGVDFFAPTRLYGLPDDMRRFVDQAHNLGIGVILDVVYNHVGSVGNYLREFSPFYFSQDKDTEWGTAINFDGEKNEPVREFFIINAVYWIKEFHLDGLRLDATQSFFDSSTEHIITAIAKHAREAAGKREIVIIAENEPQQTHIIRPVNQGGYGCDALWNDDFHHTARVALTGHREAYYTDYAGTPQEFISCIKRGYLYQGQLYGWQGKRRGTPALDIEPVQFVHFLQNHDQVANSARGLRLHELTSPGLYRTLTALLLLGPQTPMLFQGQEFASSIPFLYFCDMPETVAQLVYEGRLKFLSQFPGLAQSEMLPFMSQPEDKETFQRSKLNHVERTKHTAAYSLHYDLLKLRREDMVFHSQLRGGVDGAVLNQHAFLLRYFGDNNDDRLIIFNLGQTLVLKHIPEPLIAPPLHKQWKLIWSSENPVYGGSGTPPPEDERGAWHIMGESAIVFRAI